MAISTAFQEAIDLVDDTKVLSFATDTDYGEAEYSCDGLTITGGSDMACEIGAAALLEDMGFRFYTPHTDFWKLPDTIPTDIAISRRSNWIPASRIFLVYGHSWSGTLNASRSLLNDRYAQWALLVGANNNVWPAGHRWGNIIGSNEAFFAANPQLIRQKGGVDTLNLDGIIGTADWDLAAELCAAYMLSVGLNEFNRTHFDPVDGDDNISDHVYPFASAVAMRMRAGTEAIGGIEAQAGVPDAAIGVYAYAGHRAPPAEDYPGVFTQVALGFNNTGLTYDQLIAQHRARADAIAIREYLDTQVWSHGKPGGNSRARQHYFDRYDSFVPVVQVNSEFTANWLVNMAFARAAVLKFRTGEADYPAIIEEMVDDIFGGDSAVKDLYTHWSTARGFNIETFGQTFTMVDQMQDAWYKIHFQRLCAIYWKYWRVLDAPADYGIIRNPGEEDDTFEEEISGLLSWVTAVRDHDTVHSYAFIRQQANAKLNDYPHLKFDASPEPDWFANPVLPTADDFDAAKAEIDVEAYRPPELVAEDMLLLHVEPLAAPIGAVGNLPSNVFHTIGPAYYVGFGPSTITVTDYNTGEIADFYKFPAGPFEFESQGDVLVSFSGGMLFLDSYPSVRLEPDSTNRRHWIYIPPISRGQVDLRSGSRLSIYDGTPGRKDIVPGYDPSGIQVGQVAIDNTNTRGTMQNRNCNRWISPHPNIALVSRAMLKGRHSTIRVMTGD